jgi:hypothetical protein
MSIGRVGSLNVILEFSDGQLLFIFLSIDHIPGIGMANQFFEEENKKDGSR